MNINLLTRADSCLWNCLMVGTVLMLARMPGVQAQTLTFRFTQGFGADTRVLEGRFQGDPTRAGDRGVFDNPMDLDSFSVEFSCIQDGFFDTACNTSLSPTYDLTAVDSAPSSLFLDQSNSTPSFQFFFDPRDSSSLDFTTNLFDNTDASPETYNCPGSDLFCRITINNPDSSATVSGSVSQTRVENRGRTTVSISSRETAMVNQIQDSPEIPEGNTIWGTLLSLMLGLYFTRFAVKKHALSIK